jgi:hypothetical protein
MGGNKTMVKAAYGLDEPKGDKVEFVIHGLARYRNRNDIILEICEQSGYTWEKAAALIGWVESEKAEQIRAYRQPLLKVALSPFAGLSLVAGVALILSVQLPKALASLRWPITKGAVVSSEVVVIGISNWEGWHPRVSYRYSVDGKDYVSNDIEVIDLGNGNTDYYAQRVVEKYPPGEQLEVHYDPDNPAVALLESGIPDNDIFISLGFVVGAAGGVALVFVGLFCICGLATWGRWIDD